MARLLVLYRTPADPAAFDRYYFDVHVPLAKTIPGLKGYEVSDGPIASPAGESGYHLVATLSFDSKEAVQAAFTSPAGQAAAADLANFADGGAELIFFDDRAI